MRLLANQVWTIIDKVICRYQPGPHFILAELGFPLASSMHCSTQSSPT